MTTTLEPQTTWALDNQTGILTDVLLGRPDNFCWKPMNAISEMTFAQMEKLGYRYDHDRAMSQWQSMVDVYAGAGVRTRYLAADPGLTHSIFARDSSFMTPWGAVVAAIQTEARRRDYGVVARFYHEAGIPIWNWVSAGYFEGGDFNIIEPGSALLGYAGNRSTEAGAEQVQGWLQEQGWEAMTVPIAPAFVHLDGVLVMLAEKLALICSDALESYALDFLRARGIRWIDVPYRECVKLAVNVVNLGGERILSMAQNVDVNARMRAEGLEVYEVEYEMFTLGGGGVHCSCHELRREPT